MVKIYFLLAVMLWANCAIAQQITTAKIQAVSHDGFHKLLVPSEVRSHAKSDLSDLRLFDRKNAEVPYVVLTETPAKAVEHFETFKVLSKIAVPRKFTSIVVENPKTQLNGLQIWVANADVTKSYNVSGSNDQKEWFGLVNQAELTHLRSETATEVSKDIELPLCSYRFLKIVFDDSTTLPINVLKMGSFQTQFSKQGAFQAIQPKSVQVSQEATTKKTLIKVQFDFPQWIDKMAFNLPQTPLFKRKARIYTESARKEKHEIVTYQSDIIHIDLVSNQINAFEIPTTKQEIFFIEIENQDNPPLQITEIQCYQKPLFVVADLKAHENYSLIAGNSNWAAPQYDLAYFKETLADTLPETSVASIAQAQEMTATPKSNLGQKSWFMWICIIVGGLAILYFSIQLVKEM